VWACQPENSGNNSPLIDYCYGEEDAEGDILDAEGWGAVPAIGGVYDPVAWLRLDRVKQIGAP